MEKNSTEYKVVIQLSNNDSFVQKATIGQLNNILNAFNKIQIELVMNGPGVDLVVNESSFSNMLELQYQKGIQFIVCQNTLNQKNLTAASLLPFIKIVPSALAYLIIKQHEGWSYIKAGN